MSEEKMTIAAKQKKNLKSLAALFSNLGFTRIAYSANSLSVEKMKGQDLKGKPYFDYRIEFRPDAIVLAYFLPANRTKVVRLLEVLPTFLNIIRVAEDYYDLKPSAIYTPLNSVLNEISKMIDRDSVEFSAQLSELQSRYTDLNAKYADLVRSSEANTRILLECERKRDELQKRVSMLSGMSDELLKSSLYEWINAHSGTIDIEEFAKANNIAMTRVEEGLNRLIQEGYIKRRLE